MRTCRSVQVKEITALEDSELQMSSALFEASTFSTDLYREASNLMFELADGKPYQPIPAFLCFLGRGVEVGWAGLRTFTFAHVHVLDASGTARQKASE